MGVNTTLAKCLIACKGALNNSGSRTPDATITAAKLEVRIVLSQQMDGSMPHVKMRSLFISHSWSYTDAYEKLIGLLNAAPNFYYKNYSVPKDDPVHNAPNAAALERAIKDQMVFCDVVVVMAGKYATYSKWIQHEIAIAKNYAVPKPVLAIRPWANTQVSSVVIQNADQLVSWSTSSIVSAIRALDP